MEGTITIAKGIVNSVHAWQMEYNCKTHALEDDIHRLRGLVASYKKAFDIAPKGFKLATDSIA